jgi:hypothetical protein
MGQAKQRSKRKDEITAAAKRCVYCDATENLTLEHMPPKGLFMSAIDRLDGSLPHAICATKEQGEQMRSVSFFLLLNLLTNKIRS